MECSRCRFYVPSRVPRMGSCSRYVAYKGRGKLVYELASSVRLSESKCGPSAKFYEAREKNESREHQDLIVHLLNDDE